MCKTANYNSTAMAGWRPKVNPTKENCVFSLGPWWGQTSLVAAKGQPVARAKGQPGTKTKDQDSGTSHRPGTKSQGPGAKGQGPGSEGHGAMGHGPKREG